MYNVDTEKKERRKVVIFAGVTVALILALIVAIVVVATNKSSRKNIGGTDNASFTISENSEVKDEPVKTETKAEPKPTTTVSTKTETRAASASETVSNMPNTGPEDFLPVAVALGSLTTAGSAYIMSKKRA